MTISLLPPSLALIAILFVLPVPPGLVLVIGGLLLPLVRDQVRTTLVLGLPLLTLLLIWQVPDGVALGWSFLDYRLEPLKGTAAGRLFATVFAIAAFAGALFALQQARVLELVAAFIYAGSAILVCLAGDLITIFICWEVMALGSTLILWTAATPRAYAASFRYILIHLLGGMLLMTGIAGQVSATGSIAFTSMDLNSPAHWLLLAGLLINAGGPPLSAWVADAYPEASPSGAVFLSSFTTKTAVYMLWQGFPGAGLLIPLGLFMVFYGMIYALLENDMRRILAYSIVNQVGFMVTAIGIGSELALNGAAAHAFAHIIYKALLLMAAGSVLAMTGKRKCSDLGGLARTMPITAGCAIIGALAISAFPLTSGFIAKSMISQAAADAHLAVAWFLLTAASAAAFLYIGLRFPWLVFFGKDSGRRPPDPPLNRRLAMLLTALLCIVLGIFPDVLYVLLPYPVAYVPYTASHVVSQLQLLLFAGLAFFLLLPQLRQTLTITLDFDWFYRRLGAAIASKLMIKASQVHTWLEMALRRRLEALIRVLFRHHGPHGTLARTWPTGSMVLWVAVLLGTCLIFYYV